MLISVKIVCVWLTRSVSTEKKIKRLTIQALFIFMFCIWVLRSGVFLNIGSVQNLLQCVSWFDKYMYLRSYSCFFYPLVLLILVHICWGTKWSKLGIFYSSVHRCLLHTVGFLMINDNTRSPSFWDQNWRSMIQPPSLFWYLYVSRQ